jgi:ribonuclease HI
MHTNDEAVPLQQTLVDPKLTEQRRKVKNLAHRCARLRHSEDHPDHELYRKARNSYANLLQETKTKHWADWLVSIDQQSVWTASRLVTGPASDGGRTRVPTLRARDVTTGEEKDIATNEEKGKVFYELFFPAKPMETTVPGNPTYPPPAWKFKLITDDQIHRAIQRMRPFKSTKKNTIPNAVFKNAQDILVPHLGPIFRATFTQRVYPSHWAATESVVLKKPGKPDYTLPNAWRPVVLSNGCARLLNACITEDVAVMCEKADILPRNHFGRRAGRSTTDAVLHLVKIVKDEWRKGKVVSLLSLDVKGAFPSTAIDRLIHNMRGRGIPKEITEWMERRLANRRTTLTFDDFETEPFNVDSGLDQGDPFSQICYLIYNSGQLDIPNPRNGEHGIIYIDDSNILAAAKDFDESHRILKDVMERDGGTFDWAKQHNCEFGIEKFQLLDLSRRRQPDPNNPRKRIPVTRMALQLSNQIIPSMESIKFLGIRIDRELRWKEQGALSLKRGQDWVTEFQRISRAAGGIASIHMRCLYMAIAVPRMLYGAEVFMGSRRENERKRRAGLKGCCTTGIVTKLAAIQRKAAIAITGAMVTTATDVLDVHAGILPFHLLIDRIRHRAALRLSTLPLSHPLSKAVMNAQMRRVKRHPTPLHDLVWDYDVKPKKIETIKNVRYSTKWRPPASKEEAKEQHRRDNNEIMIYTDGSGLDGEIGAAAVLKRRGVDGWKWRRMHLGKMKVHNVHEGEGVGMILGVEMLKEERRVRGVTICVDGQAAIRAAGSGKPRPSHYIFDIFHDRLRMAHKQHPNLALTVRWTPGHDGIRGNEIADAHAKKAAEGDVSPPAQLPRPLRQQLPYSKTAMKRAYLDILWKRAEREWSRSPRQHKMRAVDPGLTTRSYRKLIDSPRNIPPSLRSCAQLTLG